jgi:WD40 repeat protein/serine/threonine protein kinase
MIDSSPHSRCDQDRLERLLVDALAEDEKADAIAHLDGCPDCQRRIERLAAGSRWWHDARLLDDPRDDDAWGDDDPLSLGFLDPPEKSDQLGRLGPYEVLEVIGRGGMGVVLKAHDPALNRFVAIKVLAPHLAGTAAARRRFAREAKAAAAVAHEHVVAIHAVDSGGRLPYLVMQYVAGKSLQQRIDATGPLETTDILRIGMQAASGLAAAHAQGLIHRDVKPSNILLENGVERVKLTDFGVAMAIDDASLTQSGLVAGTPQYMAPEQARGDAVDHRADLFSLGSVLYAMACGGPPFRASSTMAVLRRVSDERPRPVREVNPEVPGWLAAIIGRLHAKDPDDRYQTAAEVAEVLGRWLAHLHNPRIVPRPGAVRPRVRRHAWTAAFIALAVLIGLGSVSGVAQQVVEKLATVLRIKTADGVLVIEVDDPGVKVRVDGEEVVITGAGLQEFRLRPGQHAVLVEKDGKSIHNELITVERGGKKIVRVTHERPDATQSGPVAPPAPGNPEIITKVIENPAKARQFEGHTGPIRALAFAPNGKRAVSGSQDGTVRVWDVQTGEALHVLPVDPHGVLALAVTPDGDGVLTAGSGVGVSLWDVDTGALRQRFDPSGFFVTALALSPDGRIALTGEERKGLFDAAPKRDSTVRLWDIASGKMRQQFAGQPGAIRALAFSPDGRTIASASQDGTIRLWDMVSGTKLPQLDAGAPIVSVAFLPDGRLVSSGRALVAWEPGSGKQVAQLEPGWPNGPCLFAIFPSGTRLISAGSDRYFRVWDLKALREVCCFSGEGDLPLTALALSPDGRTLLMGRRDGVVSLWSLDAVLHPPRNESVRDPRAAPRRSYDPENRDPQQPHQPLPSPR